MSARAGTIAASRTRLVGRRAELALLRRLLGAARLVSVLGPPGVGKTRLALEASRPRTRGPSVIVCDLARAPARADAIALFARALGIVAPEPGSDEDVASGVGAALSARGPALVLLDNLEHLLPALARDVERWLVDAPRTRFLVTSRQALRLAAEHPLPLEGLPERDAIRLFTDRALDVDPDFDARDARADVAALVRRLDGLPLALELAAARMGVMTPAELDARLPRQLAVLRARRTTAPGRHESLRAAVEVSWSLLDDPERDVLARIAAFAASFDLDAAEAVVDPTAGGAVALALEALAGRGLVARDRGEDGRWLFRVLTSIRETIAEGIAEVPLAARRRHAEHFRDVAVRLAGGLDGAARAESLRAFGDALSELLAAHRFALEDAPELAAELALALDRALTVEGPFPLRSRILEQTADALRDGASPELAARVHIARGVARLDLGRHREAEADLFAARRIAEQAGLEVLALGATFQLGNVALFEGRWDEAQARYERALDAARTHGELLTTAKLLNNLAMLASGRGEIDDARALYAEAIATGRRVNPFYAALLLPNLAQLDHQQGHLARARSLFADAESESAISGDRFYRCFAAIGQAWLEIEEDDLAAADAALARAREMLDVVVDDRLDGLVRATAGVLLAVRDRGDDARRLFVAARVPLERAGDRGCLDALDALEGFVDLCRARAARRDRRAGHVARARERLSRLQARADAGEVMLSESRVPMRLLARATEALVAGHEAMRLEVGPEGAWFRLGTGETIDLSRRRAVRRLFGALAQRRVEAPDQPMSTAQVLAAAWPGEKMRGDSARKRLYVAVHTLRRLGLEAHLLTRGDGYLLDPALPIVARI